MMVPDCGHHFRFDFSHDVLGALAAGVAPAVSNTGRYVLNAAALAHLVQALDMSFGKSIDRFRQLKRFSMAELSLYPIDSLNESTANRKVRLSHKKIPAAWPGDIGTDQANVKT